MITLKRLKMLEAAVRAAGFGPSIDWSEAIPEPETAEHFAIEAIYVICNSGMKASVAGPIFNRCLDAVSSGVSASTVFGHIGKAKAIDEIWHNRAELFEAYQLAEDKPGFCGTLPFVGPITMQHLAKNLGFNLAKGDVHLERLAKPEQCTPQQLCERLSKLSGYSVAAIDTILWRACAEGILQSKIYGESGWKAAFKGYHPAPADEVTPQDTEE